MDSRQQARAAIAAGRVLVAGSPAATPARMVAPDEPVVVAGPRPRFVSRGGEKLEAALDRFGIAVAGRSALDAGASTGGFTDCLLQRGVASVLAVDVGYGQIHPKLRDHHRVTVLDRTNVRSLSLPIPVDIVTADLSFISLGTVAAALLGPNARRGAEVVVLVKPQFEAGRAEASRARGVIRDPAVWRRVLGDVRGAMAVHEAAMMDVMVSPLRGAEGNVEFLAHLYAHTPTPGVDDARLDQVVAEAAGRL